MLNVIRPIPCRMPSAKALLCISRGSAKVNRRSVSHRAIRKEPLQIRSNVTQTRPRNSLLVLCLDGAGCANEIVRNPEADSEMMREVVAASKCPIDYRPVATRAALESRAQTPARIEPSFRLRHAAGCRVRSLRLAPLRGAH